MLAEGLEKLVSLIRSGDKPIAIQEDANKVVVLVKGTVHEFPKRLWPKVDAFSVAALIEWANANTGIEAATFYSESEVVVQCHAHENIGAARVELSLTDAFNWLESAAGSGVALEQRQLIRLLRVTLDGCLVGGAATVDRFRKIDVTNVTKAASQITKTTDKGMREFAVEAAGDVPDEIRVSTTVFDNAEEPTSKEVRVLVELDMTVSPVKFILTPVNREVVEAKQVAMAEIRKSLEDNLNNKSIFNAQSDVSYKGTSLAMTR